MLEKYRNGPFITYTLFAIQVVVFLLGVPFTSEAIR